ncbi:hypothetical protein JN01_0490 [Entomoplasma freundtii]|uniref:HD superfamily phosphohydrolase n=1 Tax=Entomoplasma freundtii TaxID=74700 RepID=A0A2K8NQJ5_9MOLU|nr:HD domain-containing protein [Entomoplasma freundtii]ATZ16110.1 HD superfamily phosphohydrolase [Entomoplasma freundtii]TDY56989.1 hypothetical protein JN01_0490 [Entomoplasma freundtii]
MYEKVIRDNVHGDIYFHEPIFMEIMNTPEMQRLRRVSQLAGASLAYPGATHTRFAHSIGTYHILNLFFEAQDFQKISKAEKRLTYLAGLMHDIGHGPFSHTFEKINPRNHEEYSIDIIKNPKGNISKILKKYKINPDDVAAIIDGKYPNKVLNLLVSSQLDADRLDYLMRDSYGAGVDYALLDAKWIVRHAKIMDDKIVFPLKTLNAIESYLLGRHHMYQQVYNHPSSIAFDSLFTLWFKRFLELANNNYSFKNLAIVDYFDDRIKDQPLSLKKYLQLDDPLMMSFFANGAQESDQIFSDLSKRLLNRGLFKVVKSTPHLKSKISNQLAQKGYDLRYYFDEYIPKRSTVYQNDFSGKKDETIWFDEGGQIKPLSTLSVFTNSINLVTTNNNEKNLLFPKELV